MKRPLAVSGFTALILVLCFIHFESTALALCILILAAAGLVISTFIKSKQAVYCATICFGTIFACLLFMHTELKKEQTFHLCDENAAVHALISERPEFSHEKGRYYAVAKLESINGEKAYGKIRLSFSETYDEIDPDTLEIGDKITFNGSVYKIGESLDEIHNYYSSIGIYTGVYGIEKLETDAPSHRPISYYVDRIRTSLINKISYSFDSETAGIIIAILTGEKSYTSDDTYSMFKQSGAAHIMAVSGMHLSVWILFLSFLLESFKRHRVLTNMILGAAVVFIMFLASFSPSVMRAGFMVLLHLFAKAIGRETDGLNSVGFAVICLLIFNPYIAVNVGFLLSVLSVVSIFLLALPCHDFMTRKFINKFSSQIFQKTVSAVILSLCISLAVTLFTFPIMVIAFGGVSLISPLTNILLLPVITPLIVLSAFYLLSSFIPVLSFILSLAVKVTVTYTLNIVNFTSSLPFSYISADFSYIVIWLILASLVCTTVLLMKIKRLNLAKISVMAISFVLIFSVFTELSSTLTDLKITPLRYEDDCCYIVSMNGRAILIGLSDYYYFETDLKNTVEELNISIDAVLCLEGMNDSGADFIAAQYKTRIIDDEGEGVTLFDEIKIEHRGDYATLDGYGIYTVFFQKEGLQSNLNCDIIYDRSGMRFCNNEIGAEQYDYSFASTTVINKNGDYSIRGEFFG